MDWNHKELSEARKNLLASIQNPNEISYTQVLPKQTKGKYVKNAVIMLHNFEKSAINRGEVPVGTEKIFQATLKGIEQLMEATEFPGSKDFKQISRRQICVIFYPGIHS